MTALGNTRLVQYGIQTEGSDYRAHVCVTASTLYVYATKDGVKCAADERFRKVPVGRGIITAEGRLVPPWAIDGCMRVPIPREVMEQQRIERTDSTTVKGQKATRLVATMMEECLFPAPLQAKIILEGTAMQFDGVDIVASTNLRIQVKCDFDGGEKEYGGTGNLFLQTAECNPYRAH